MFSRIKLSRTNFQFLKSFRFKLSSYVCLDHSIFKTNAFNYLIIEPKTFNWKETKSLRFFHVRFFLNYKLRELLIFLIFSFLLEYIKTSVFWRRVYYSSISSPSWYYFKWDSSIFRRNYWKESNCRRYWYHLFCNWELTCLFFEYLI